MSFFKDLPLRTKGLIVVAIPIGALLLIVAAFYFVHQQEQSADYWIQRTYEVRNQIQMVRTRWETSETGILGYLMTGNDRWLEPFRAAREQLPGIFDDLEDYTSGSPGVLKRVKEVEARINSRMDRLEELPAKAELLRSSSDPARLLEGTREEQGAIRQGLTSLRMEQERVLAQQLADADAVQTQGHIVIFAGLILALVGGLLAMVLFTNMVSRRIQALDENAHRLASGIPVAPLNAGKDEVGRLAESLGEAAALLEGRQRDLQHLASDLESRVHERTAALEQANTALGGEVTERKRAEEGLADAKQRLEAVIDASPLAIIGLDLEANVLGWNRAAEELFGWTSSEVMGKPLPALPDDGTPTFRSLFMNAAKGEVLTAYDTRRRRKDGTPVDIRVWTAPLASPDGEVRGQIALIADITQERKLEQQFAQAQKMEAIGRLAGGVAHDFNNVITVVSGYGHMLLEGVQNDPPLREAAEEVLRSADRAAGLASQLLAFSRRQVIQPRVLDLNSLVANMERMLGRVIGEDVELRTVLRPEVATVRADPGQLEQVVMNLAVNARDAMPQGGKLTIETGNTVLDDSYPGTHSGVQPGPYVMLAVSDTGNGMDSETKAHLFEPFYTTKEKGKGTGLGLSTVYGIVKQHGGDIWVYSEPGRGTSFKIYLPQMASEPADGAAKPVAAPARHGTEQILLVEDEDGVRHLVREILEQRGYKVMEASSGEAALAILERDHQSFELLLTDVVMPKMSGRDLAEAAALLRPNLRVLFLSGYTDQVVMDHGVAGTADFLQKPFTPETLAHKVREVLDRPARRKNSGE
ncbi:MAG TPA: ATP-binding protein [Bryobacteraceae bacterium]|nr:ATP-binding protein [Bryobacteraceae bacterium]